MNSSQDGGIGRQGLPHPTTASTLQLKDRTTHHSELSEIELNVSLTTMKLKKPHHPDW